MWRASMLHTIKIKKKKRAKITANFKFQNSGICIRQASLRKKLEARE